MSSRRRRRRRRVVVGTYHPPRPLRLSPPPVLFASDGGADLDGPDEDDKKDDEEEKEEEERGSSISSLIRNVDSFLDTPILDANDRTDQGLLAESLKRFVRSDPQIASITFSAIVVTFIAILIRTFNYITYGM